MSDMHQRGIVEEDRNYATCNRELACLRHIFNIAIEWEMLTKNPVASKAIKFDKEKSRKRTLENDELSRLLHVCTGQLHQIVTMALNTGMSLGEILSLSGRTSSSIRGRSKSNIQRTVKTGPFQSIQIYGRC